MNKPRPRTFVHTITVSDSAYLLYFEQEGPGYRVTCLNDPELPAFRAEPHGNTWRLTGDLPNKAGFEKLLIPHLHERHQ